MADTNRFLSSGLACLLLVISSSLAIHAAPTETHSSKVENFQLLDQNGASRELHRQNHSKAVVLFVTGNGCPIARQTAPTLQALEKEFGPKGIQFWMINGNAQDDRESIQKEAAEFSIQLPILVDRGQWVSEMLGATRTGEAIMVTTTNWNIFYRGAVDDRLGYGTQKSEPSHFYLSNALNAFLVGNPAPEAQTEFKGCAIQFEKTTDSKAPVYTREVAPLLKQHCVGCHSTGHIGPFAMTNYEKVKGWAAMTREVLLEQRMPPWPGDREIGQWKGHRALSLGETKTLLRWIAAGAPRGEGPDLLASLASAPPPDWPLGKPDYILSMPKPFSVPATGVIPYQYFEVENPIQEDAWLRAAVVKPGNAKVLHHALIFVKYPEHLKSIEPRQNGGTAGYFTGFVPGAEAVPFPEGTGKYLPKVTRIIFQIHYSPTGKAETDLTELGLYLLQSKPEWELRTRAATQTELLITPGERVHKTKATYTFRKEAVLHSLSPHMHVRGTSFKYDLVYPGGKTETILSVPRWDFNWQTLYRFSDPKKVPAGTELICSGTFDNSATNPSNPNPKQWVIFGEQTTDEMFIGYYDIAVRPMEPVSGPKPEKKKLATPSEGGASSE